MKTVKIDEAKAALIKGDVVAIPTETVYGLAGWIQSEAGLKKIFAAKERPFFDPLIVHIDSIEKAKLLTSDWTPVHEILAQKCWPGPLTLIAKKHPSVNPLITSGLDSVGLRCPDHELTLKLLSQLEGGLAAPSANKFGKTSPTRAEHVADEFGETVSILDGGPCQVGIESTVAGIEKSADSWKVKIFRPGHFTAQKLQKILAENNLNATVEYAESPVAPGQLKHHYMPKIPVVIVAQNFDWNQQRSIIENKLGKVLQKPAIWKLESDPNLASRMLYENLRRFSESGHDAIIVYRDVAHRSDDWMGIWNRLFKAKTFEVLENLTLLE